jgi:hypothetical protein
MLDRLQAVLNLVSKTMPVRSRGVELSTFTVLEALFRKLDSVSALKAEGHDTQPQSELTHKLLFQHDANAYMESIRLQRAKALLALSKIPWLAFVRIVLKPDVVVAEISKAPSSAVQDILRRVNKRLA